MKRLLTVMLVSGVMISLLLSLGLSSSSLPPIALAAPGREAPKVIAVEPNEAPNDLDIPVVISGEGFAETPRVYLGETELTEVTWVSETELSAVVPWGMDPGVYALMIENPGGETSTLAEAFTVTQGIGEWTTGGPYGGFVEFLSLGDEHGEIVYAIVNNVGLFRSQNSGESWEWLFLTGYSDRVEVDPTNPDRLYISKLTHDDRNLYRSEDRGDTWTAMPTPMLANNAAFHAFVSPQKGEVFGAIYDPEELCPDPKGCGLFRFDESAQSWIQLEHENVLDNSTSVSRVAFDPIDDDIMYAGLFGGEVIKSEDGGETWSSLGQSPTDDFNEIRVNPVTKEIWVACGGANSTLDGGLYRYDGSAWKSMYVSPQSSTIVRQIIFEPEPNDASFQKIWIASNDLLQISVDGGKNWDRAADCGQNTFALNPHLPQVIYCNGESGVLKITNNGENIEIINEGLTGIVPEFLAVHPFDPAIVYSCDVRVNQLFGSKNGGQTWQSLGSCRGPITMDSDPANERVVVALDRHVLIADDGWDFNRIALYPMPPGMDEEDYGTVIMAMIARPGLWVMGVGYGDKSLPFHNFDGGGGIYLSPDGEYWTLVKYGLEGPPTGFAFDPGDEDVIYAITSGGEHGTIIHEGTFLRSIDGGENWHESAVGNPPTEDKIAVEPTPPYRIFTGCSVSADQGLTWTGTVCPGDVPPNHLVYLEGSPNILYASTGVGLYRTLDGAQTWQRAAGELGTLAVWSLTGIADEDRHIIYVGTAGGVFEAEEFEAQGLRTTQEVLINPGVYRLANVFPPVFKIYLPLLGR